MLVGCAPPPSSDSTVTLFFYSDGDLQNASFENPVVVQRTVPQENAMDTALRALFDGPTDEEVLAGARTSDDLTSLQDLYLGVRTEGNNAIVNFANDALKILNSAAARQLMAKEPIQRTLMQFPGIQNVQYEIDGELFDEWDA